MTSRGDWLFRAARYGLVGVLNTVLGLTIIEGLDLGLHVPPVLANAAGYVCGVALAYGLNRRFVFRSRARARTTGPRFLAATAGAYLLNIGALQGALGLLGPGGIQHAVSQIFAMGVYTVSQFLACQLWVFKPTKTSDAGDA